MLRFATFAVIILAAIDGLTHLALNLFALHRFTGNLFATLFTLYVLGYVVAIPLFAWAQSQSLSTRKLMDGLMALIPIIGIVTWVYLTHAKGNPMGLAYIAKPDEVLLVIAVALHFMALNPESQPGMAGA